MIRQSLGSVAYLEVEEGQEVSVKTLSPYKPSFVRWGKSSASECQIFEGLDVERSKTETETEKCYRNQDIFPICEDILILVRSL